MHSDLILSHKAQKEPQGWSASLTCWPWPLSLLLWVCKLREIKVFWELHWWLSGKESACNSGDLGSIPELGRFPGEGNGSPLQYFCLENFMDRGAWWATVHGVAKSWTWLSMHIQRSSKGRVSSFSNNLTMILKDCILRSWQATVHGDARDLDMT